MLNEKVGNARFTENMIKIFRTIKEIPKGYKGKSILVFKDLGSYDYQFLRTSLDFDGDRFIFGKGVCIEVDSGRIHRE